MYLHRLGLCFALCAAFSAVLAFPGLARPALADPPQPVGSPAEIVPATALVYAELSQPKQVIGLVLDHPLTKRILEIPEVQKGMENDKFREFQNAVALVEDKIGQKWRPALETVFGGGVTFVGDMATQGGAVLIKSQDEALLKKLIDALMDLGRAKAANEGKEDPFEIKEYRGIQAYKVGEGYFAVVGPWYIVTNKAELGRTIIDLYRDRKDGGLAGHDEFRAARKLALGDSPRPADIGWGYLRLTPLRSFGALAKLSEKTPNPAAELIAGGVLSTLERSPYLTTTLSADAGEVKLAFASPHEGSWTPETRKFYFGGGGSTAPLKAPETLLSVVTHRDLGALWLAASDLFNEETAAEMAKADSSLSLFFSGKNFGKEVLGGLGPNWQLLLARPRFTQGAGPIPAIKLPSSALVFELKDVEKMRTQFKVAFQSTLGFLNIISAQAGNPQMELDTEKLADGAVILSANYLLEPEMKKELDAKIHFNFSPALALVGNRAILASSKQLAADLAAEAAKASQNAKILENTLMELDLQVGKKLVVDNLNQLIAQNVLEKGHTQAEAEKEIGGLVELMSWLEQSWVKLTAEEKSLRFEMGLKLKK